MKKYMFAHPLLFTSYCIVTLASATASVFFAFVMGAFVDLVVGGTMEKLYQTVGISIIWLISNTLLDWAYRYLQNKVLKNILVELRGDLFNKIMHKNVKDFNSANSGTYLADLTTNISNLEGCYFAPILISIGAFANVILSFFSMLYIDVTTIYMIVILMFLCALIPNIAKSFIEKKSSQYLGGVDAYTIHAKEYLNGFMVFRTFLAFPQVEQKHQSYSNDLESKRISQSNLNSIISCVTSFMGIFATIIALGFGAYLTITGRTSGGAITSLGHLIGRVASAFSMITMLISNLTAARPIIKRYEKILNEKDEDENGSDTINDVNSITCSNLEFSYNDKPIIKNISLNLEKGKSYAIVGDSGSGKTTLFNLLLKYYDNYNGTILLNNTDLHTLSRNGVYKNIGTVSQNVFLFEDTILNNVTLFKPYSEEQVWAVLEKAGLKPFIKSLPNGLNTLISENGDNFSGGEKQRLALARTLIHNCTVLLLDEFTANLDMQVAASIENQITQLNDKIIVHITHKIVPEFLRKYDEIIVFKNGQIVEHDNYDNLMMKKASFHQLQSLEV